MALATRCPGCHAVFRVVADQLKLRGGLVRCGACGHVFDAIGTLSYLDDTSVRPAASPPAAAAETQAAPPAEPLESPVTSTPLVEEATATEDAHAPPTFAGEIAPAALEQPAAATETPPQPEDTMEPEATPIEQTLPPPTAAPPTVEAEPAIDIGAPAFLHEQTPRRRAARIVYGIGAAIAALALALQLVLLFRTDIVAQWPAARPALVSLCEAMRCTVGWPMRGELLAVVGSELQALPGTNALELTAVVRNRATVTLALPALEVTLTDTQNRALARKVFRPDDYLPPPERDARLADGLAAGADMTIRITFEARGISVAGFVVYPFYL